MCGICGIVSRRLDEAELDRRVQPMVDALAHRGPDGRGSETFAPRRDRWGVALGHTRLAIIDLSSAGLQPMRNEDGAVSVIFNGEIYNFRELRAELEGAGHRFRSHTDTEVLVHLYEDLGPACVARLNGMFAIAFMDAREGRLTLARDQLGVKPMYYAAAPDRLLFASEIKSILAAGLHKVDVDWQAIHDYFTYLYVPCPATAFRGIRQLPPAHYLTIDLRDGTQRMERYWAVRRLPEVETASDAELSERARTLLADSVSRQLVSDVPLGVFLSGGVDSTVITGLAAESHPAVSTFTVSFDGPDLAAYDEGEIAQAVSRHLGTDHHELSMPAPQPVELLNMVTSFDEPFGNPTAYLMYLISRAARDHVTVALCGAGGDELYAGYPRYRAMQLARRLRGVPRSALRLAATPLDLLHDSYRSMRLRRAREFLRGVDADPIQQFANWTYFFDEGEKHALLRPGGPALPASRVLHEAWDRSPLPDADNRLLHVDVQTFLLDNLLQYTDRASMSVALETRVPLLDHRFVEFSLNVPFRQKLDGRRSKLLLRRTFARYFPEEALRAPKRGFNAPLALWMRGTLDRYFEGGGGRAHPWQELLGEGIGTTWRDGILNPACIERLREHLHRGRADTSYELFSIMMFDAWWTRYISRGADVRAGEQSSGSASLPVGWS